MDTTLQRFSRNVIEASWLFALAATPLFYNQWTTQTFDPDKIALLRTAVLVLLAAALGLWLHTKKIDLQPLRRPEIFLGVAFAVWIFIAGSAAVIPSQSFWGNYQRQQGALSTAAYAILFLAVAMLFKSAAQFIRLRNLIVFVSMPVAVYAIAQKLKFDPFFLPQIDTSFRPHSTLGNANFLAGYLALAMPLTLAALLDAGRQWQRAIPLILVGALQIAAVVISQSRAGALACVAGALLFLLLSTIAARRKGWFFTLVGAGVLAVAFLITLNLKVGPLQSLTKIPLFERLANLVDYSASQRLNVYFGAIELLQANPGRALIGYGPDCVEEVIMPHLPALAVAGNVQYDRLHNDTLELIVSAGIFGAALYWAWIVALLAAGLRTLGLIASRTQCNAFIGTFCGGALIAALVAYRNQPPLAFAAFTGGALVGLTLFIVARGIQSHYAPKLDNFDWPQVAACAGIAALAAHLLETAFSFPVPATRTYFCVLAGLLCAVPAASSAPQTPPRFTGAIAAVTMLLLLGFALPPELRAENYNKFVALVLSVTLLLLTVSAGALRTPLPHRQTILRGGVILAAGLIATQLLTGSAARAAASPATQLALFLAVCAAVFALLLPHNDGPARSAPAMDRLQSAGLLVLALIIAVPACFSNILADAYHKLSARAALANRPAEESAAFAHRAVELNPNKENLCNLSARLLVAAAADASRRTALLDESEAALQRAWVLNPFSVLTADRYANFFRAKANLHTESPAEYAKATHAAAGWSAKVVSLAPHNAAFIQFHDQLAALAARRGNAIYAVGAHLLGQRKLDDAETHLQAALLLLPDDWRVNHDLAALYVARNQPERAVEFARTALKTAPEKHRPTLEAYVRHYAKPDR